MVRVGTWNLENLFRPAPDATQEAKDAYEAKLAALASLIDDMAPDVLAVQEVGQPEALQDLASTAGGAWHTATADPDGRGIRVGFLSRLELANTTQVAAFPDKLRPIQVDDTTATINAMGRPALSTRLRLPSGADLQLVSCHSNRSC